MYLFQKGLDYKGEGEIEAEVKSVGKEKETVQTAQDRLCSRLMDEDARKDRLEAAKAVASQYRKPMKKLDFAAKRKIIQGLVKRIEVHPAKIRVEFVVSKPDVFHQKSQWRIRLLNNPRSQVGRPIPTLE